MLPDNGYVVFLLIGKYNKLVDFFNKRTVLHQNYAGIESRVHTNPEKEHILL